MLTPPKTAINNATTTKVYGRRNASLTIHISFPRATVKAVLFPKHNAIGAPEWRILSGRHRAI
jgi:hypothetical protein